MSDDLMNEIAAAKDKSSIIMVVGVGGAGGNAVNHMWNLGIKDVGFMVCNTDAQALDNSPVEEKVQLGREGLGAGNDPENGRKAAIESLDDIRRRLEAAGTRMLFVTAGMGGGTGTGYVPVSVARGALYTLLPAPARDGHVFIGWKVGSAVKRPGEKITVNAAVTVSAQWLTVDEWIGQRLNIRVDVDVDVSVAIGTDQQQQEISADVSEESRAWLRAQVEEWIRALLAQGAPPELDAEHAAMLLRLLSAGADSVDVTLTVGVPAS